MANRGHGTLLALVVALGAGCGGGSGGGGPGHSGATPPAGAPIVSPPADLSSVMRAVHFSFRSANGGFEAGHDTHGVVVDGAGAVAFTPAVPAGDGSGSARSGAPLRVETSAVARGGVRLDAPAGPPAVDRDGSLWTPRGPVIEHLQNADAGVEQSWQFPWKPEGAGDLTVRVRLAGLDAAGETATGHHFVDPVSGLGVRYGKASWVDRLGVTTEVAAQADGSELVLSVPAAVVDGSVFPAVLDPVITSEVEIDQPAATTWTPADPAVATNGSTLAVAVWADASRGGVWGARLDASTGNVLDPDGFAVTTGTVSRPAIAYSASNTSFLAAWGGAGGIRFSRFQLSGTTLTTLQSSVLIGSSAGGGSPSVAADPGNGRFLVAWLNNTTVSGSLISSGGTAGAPVSYAANAAAPPSVGPAIANRFLVAWSSGTAVAAARTATTSAAAAQTLASVIAVTGDSIGRPRVAVNGTTTSSEWVVVGSTSSTGRILGRRIVVTGTNNNGASVRGALTELVASGASAPAAAFSTRVTTPATTNYYVLAWIAGGTPTWSYFRTPASADTTSGPATLGTPAALTVQPVTGTSLGITQPSAAATNVVLWIDGARVDQARVGTYSSGVLGSSPVSAPTPIQSAPAIAASSTGYLAVWQDARRGGADVYGVRLGADGKVLAGSSPFAIAATGVSETAPAVASDGSNYLVAWSDGAIRTTLVNGSTGALSGLAATWSAGQSTPRVAFSQTASAYLVVWTDTALNANPPNVYGLRFNASGAFVGAPFAISSSVAIEQAPDVAALAAGGWVVALQHGSTIVGRQVRIDGTLGGAGNFVLPTTAAPSTPSVACGAAGGCLVAWAEGAAGSQEVKGARTDGISVVSDATALTLGSAAGDQLRPSVAFEGRDFAVVFEDRRNGAAEVWANRVPISGLPLDGTGVALTDASNPSAVGAFPRLASAGVDRGVVVFTRRSPSPTAVDSVWARALVYRNGIAIAKTGAGTGTVTSPGGAIACGATCSGSFDAGVPVVLTATPDANMRFVAWGGACAGVAATCTVTPGDQSPSVTAQFEPIPQLQLTVALNGQGLVQSQGATPTIDCGTSCAQPYFDGTQVTLTASPSSGYTFAGWSGGGCSGTGNCTVTMTGPTTVTAQFDQITYALTLGTSGSGSIGAAPQPNGANGTYVAATTVTLTANPAPDWRFDSWSDACAGQGRICTVSMDAAKSATATFLFAPVTYALSVAKAGDGSGTVTSTEASPSIDCGSFCSFPYVHDVQVTLRAAPAAGSSFTGWTGPCVIANGECTVTMTGATDVTATFAALPPPTAHLSLSVAGAGLGRVASAPAGIDCTSGTCGHDFLLGTGVTLTATADPATPPGGGSYAFAGWSGAGCSGTGTCTVTMDAARDVTATFNEIDLRTLTVVNAGGGTVRDDSPQITCGAACVGSYLDGTLVTLTATPAAGATFAGWSGGGCSGTSPCSVLMDAGTTVTAQFTYPVTVSRAGTGTGSVTSTPTGVSCGTACAADFAFDSTVTLAATPGASSVFSGWAGAGCTGNGTCSFKVLGLTDVTATFDIPPPQYWSFRVSTQGTGTGAVNVSATSTATACQPPATGCARYVSGTALTLTAVVQPGSVFGGWSGGGCGAGVTCTVTLTADTAVTATFNPAPPTTFPLAVRKAGTGAGTVSGGPISCGLACDTSLAAGAQVDLAATPAPGSVFAGWSGGGCTGLGACRVTMNGPASVYALFSSTSPGDPASFTVATAVGGPGRGSVSSASGGLVCYGQALCAVNVARTSPPTLVTLTAAPEAGSRFAGWTDGCTGAGSCVLPMDGARLARAVFVPQVAQVSVALDGKGSIQTAPAGALTCDGRGCAGFFPTDAAAVTLTAVESVPGWRFAGWVGQDCAGTGGCTVRPDRDRALTARFVPTSSTLTVLPMGGGPLSEVTLTLQGVQYTCTEAGPCSIAVPTPLLAPITLTASYPTADYDLVGWSGCAAAGDSCVVSGMSGPSVVLATFGPKTYGATIQLVGPGSGTVTSDAGTCAGTGTTCSWDVLKGQVTFDAVADAGSFFYGWGGVCPRTADASCTVNFLGSGTVQAVFEPETLPLTIGIDGTGQVTYVVNTTTPLGDTCTGTGCTVDVNNRQNPERQTVTLVATPSGSTFWGWSGACQTTERTCTVTMNGAQETTAHFLPLP